MSENLERALGKVEGRMSGVELQLAALTTALNNRLDTESKRTTSLERTQWRLSGGLAVLIFLVPVAAKAFGIL